MATFSEERKKKSKLWVFLGFPLSELPSLKHLRKQPRELVEIQTPSLTPEVLNV